MLTPKRELTQGKDSYKTVNVLRTVWYVALFLNLRQPIRQFCDMIEKV